jgi:hypothetical protein
MPYADMIEKVQNTCVSAGELRHIRACLPDEYGELFGEAPKSPVSPSAV